MDLHHEADRILFTMPNGRSWQIHEMSVDGSGLRQVSREIADVDNFDPCYLPDGRIVFASTAAFTGVPCWHGKERACCLYTMHADGTHVRQLCYDQDLDLHPSVLDNGQVIIQSLGLHGALARLRPAADGHEPGWFRTTRGLRQQLVLSQLSLFSAWRAGPPQQDRGHSERVPWQESHGRAWLF